MISLSFNIQWVRIISPGALLVKAGLVTIVLLTYFYPGVATADYVVTDKDLLILPEYCAVRTRLGIDNSKPKVVYWKGVMGQTYDHLHHYCRAQKYLNCGKLEVDKKERSECLARALDQFDYVLERMSNNFPLEPEVHVLKGDTLYLLGRTGDAMSEYNQAIAIKPDYLKSYRNEAKMLQEIGQIPQAIAVIEQGLKVKPRSRSLTRMLEELKE